MPAQNPNEKIRKFESCLSESARHCILTIFNNHSRNVPNPVIWITGGEGTLKEHLWRVAISSLRNCLMRTLNRDGGPNICITGIEETEQHALTIQQQQLFLVSDIIRVISNAS